MSCTRVSTAKQSKEPASTAKQSNWKKWGKIDVNISSCQTSCWLHFVSAYWSAWSREIKCQLHRIWNFELCQLLCFFGIRINFSVNRVSVPWDMQRVVVEKWSKLSRNNFKMLYDASFDVTWQINPIHFQVPFQQRKRGSGPYLDSCLPDSHSSS